MRHITTLCSLLACCAIHAGVTPTNVAQIVARSTGGTVSTIFKNTKKIYYINAQERIKTETLEAARRKMETLLKTPIEMKSGTFAFPKPTIEGELSLYVIDREDFPISLVAPEGRWAFVNVAPLTKGRGKKPQFLEARVKKEMARIACILFGNMGSSYKRNLMSFLSSAEDLDSFDSDNIPIDSLMRCSHYLLTLGVKPYRRVSYRKACEEGWAPAPTNDIQRVIWEETRQLPTKPIKIEFDPAKGK